MLLLVIAAAIVAAVAIISFQDDEDAPAAPAVTPLPTCSSLGRVVEGERECRTRSAVITEVSSRRLLRLSDVHARVVDAVLTRAGEIQVRLTVTNRLAWPARFNERRRQAYLSVGGRRIYARTQRGASAFGRTSNPVEPAARRTGTLIFTASPGAVRALERRGRQADLAVLPFTALPSEDPASYGVIHLRIGDAAGR